MHERFQALVHGALLALIIGWVLYIGKPIFVPVVLSVLVVYVIVGLTRLLERIPVLGSALPRWLRDALSIVVIALGLVAAFYEILTYADILREHAPQYQKSLLAAIQRGAALVGIEGEPTWATLRRELLAQTDMQRLVGSTVASVTSLVATILFVFVCSAFLLLERRTFAVKMDRATGNPRDAARILAIVADVNDRIGSYLVLKTFLSILLGAVSWVIMALFSLEFAGFWAVLIALLNYIPYVGSILGVLFPALMAVVQYGSIDEIFALLFLLAIAQFVIGNFLDPYVMSNTLNLSPFAILVSLTVWSALWGVAGAFLAVPITATMTIVLSEFAGTRPIAVLLSRDGRL